MNLFHIILIKPTHYDRQGYPISWFRSVIPSNSLAAMNGLMADCVTRQVLGSDVTFRVQVMDECNTRVRPEKLIRQIRREGGQAMIGFVGVQTNQFPRMVDLAQPFLEAGLPVIAGGFHISGCLSMLSEMPADLVEAQDKGICFFAGEAEEGRLDEVLRDAYTGQLKPLYTHLNDLPGLEGAPVPYLEDAQVSRVMNDFASFDLGRGCPYQCSFCTIINVQGRKSRFRTADDLEAIVRRNAAQGIHKFFVTDDDLARNKNWEMFFDRLIDLRENHGLKVNLFVQVDTMCHQIDGFIEKACRAGASRIFMGLENINPENLLAVNKRQNKITEYRAMMQEWRKYGATLYAGYIIGFPNDTRESVLRDVEIIKRELPLDVLEFFYLTPLPGSADHKRMVEEGVWMDPDMNKYDLFHRVTHHPRMSDAEWEQTYHDAWTSFFAPDHIETVGQRAVSEPVRGVNVDEVFEFWLTYHVEGLHPLDGGILRIKSRRDRRRGMKLENPLVYYPSYALETLRKLVGFLRGIRQAKRMHARIHANPEKHDYRDLAVTRASTQDFDRLDLFQETDGGRAAVRRHQVISGAALES